MSEIQSFFRSCPNCGKRFEVKLTSKKLVDERTVRTEVPRAKSTSSTSATYGLYAPEFVTPVSAEEPAVLAVEEFRYGYECKHCGHKWFEVREKETKVSEGEFQQH